MDFLRELLRLLGALSDRGVEYVLVGGGALNVHGLVRATEDADLFIRPTADNVARLREALHDVWEDPSIDEIKAEDLCGDFPAVRYGPPEGAIYLDILTRLGELFAYEDLEWETVELEGTPVRVATPATLIRMSRETVRPIDAADVRALADAFGLDNDPRGRRATVERYRDASEMPPPPRATGEDLARRIAAAWERAQIRGAVDLPRGVLKFRTIEAANAAREARTAERLRALRQSPAQPARHGRMERVANKAHGFEEARRWELAQYRRMTPDERRAVARALRDRAYGRDRPDVREAERAK